MAEGENSNEDKTEEPSGRRLDKAREEGQILRSRDLTMAVLALSGATGVYLFGHLLLEQIIMFTRGIFTLQRNSFYSENFLPNMIFYSINTFIKILSPFLIFLFFIALITPNLLGGFNISAKAIEVNWSKISPLSGLKRLLSLNTFIELGKSIAKLAVTASIAYLVIHSEVEHILNLGNEVFEMALDDAVHILRKSFLLIATGLLVIAAVDVPYQVWNYTKKLKMTKQEVKDEYKDVEGKPEVKQKIRQKQNELSRSRMMQEVPKADVVIVNPTHYAVAIRYDNQSEAAPVVAAKGLDETAQAIRLKAKEHNIPIVEAPPLARALYYSTILYHEIPEGLYVAVAQVLAYVYQLKRHANGKATKPSLNPDLPIPDEYRRS